MADSHLKQKAASGMVWTAFQKYSLMGIQFISGIILARLLTAYDYGCIGMLSIFMIIAETFIDGGFGSALIQKKQPTQQDYSTIFWWNLGMALLMYILLYLGAPLVARFYDIPLLQDVLRVEGLVLFIYAFNIVQRNQLRKQLKFKTLSIVTIGTTIVSLTVTIWMAYKGFGVWALVAQSLVTAFIPALVFWFVIRWRPILHFSKESFHSLFGFGFYMFATNMVNRFSSRLVGLLIGKLYSPATLGYYSKALNVQNMASHSVSSVISQVTYPLYAQVQDNRTRMINMIKRLTMTISFITFPIMFILMLTARPIFVLLYSERWLNSVPYFQVLCLVGLSECLQAVNTQTIAAIGKSKTMFNWSLLKWAFGLSFIIGGLVAFGMKGLLVGVVIFNWFCYSVNIGLVSKYIGYSWKAQLLDILPVAAVSCLAALVSFWVGELLGTGLYVDGIIKLLVFAIIYVGWALLFKPEAYSYTLTVIPNRFRFWRGKKHLNGSD